MKYINKSMAILSLLVSQSIYAEQSPWYLQLGPASVGFNESTSVSAAGNPVVGGQATVSNEQTLGLGIGYQLSPRYSVMGLVGVPLTSDVAGAGSLAGLTVGEVEYGPLLLVGNYHFDLADSAFKPFVGAGVAYNIVFDEKDGQLVDLAADDSVGAVFRAGFEYSFSDRSGLYFSLNKLLISTELTGVVDPNVPGLGGAPVIADIDLDPLIAHAGYAYKF